MMVVVTPSSPPKKTEKGNERKNNTNKDHSFPATKLRPAGESAQHMDQFLCYSFMGKRFPFLLLLSLLGLISAVASPSSSSHFMLMPFSFPGKTGCFEMAIFDFFSSKCWFFVNLGALYFFLGGGGACLRRGKEMPENLANKEEEAKARCVSLLPSFLPHFLGSDVAIFPNSKSGHAPQ